MKEAAKGLISTIRFAKSGFFRAYSTRQRKRPPERLINSRKVVSVSMRSPRPDRIELSVDDAEE
jgi:hypothetical protein